MNPCAAVQTAFHKSVNMTPAEIRAWAKDPRNKCASEAATVQRLTHPQRWKGFTQPALAELKGRALSRWDEDACRYAKRVINFNARHERQRAKQGNKCSVPRVVALRNWGRKVACPLPKTACKVRRYKGTGR